MAGKYDSAWQDYSSIIEGGEGQEFFDAGPVDPAPQPAVTPGAPTAEPSKYDQAFSEYDAEPEQEGGFGSELGPALRTTVQRTKGMTGAGLELVTRHLQDAAEKRKKSPTKTQERLGLYTDIIDAIIPGVELPRDTPERYGEYIESSKKIQESAQKELDKIPQAPEFVRTGDWWENLKDPDTRSDQLTWMLGSNVGPTIAIGAAALIAGITTGPGGAVIAGSSGAFLLEGGSSYKDLLKMGVPEEDARGTAAVVGTINAALEMVPLGMLAKRVPGIKKMIGMQVAKEMAAKPVLRRAITGALSQGAIESATEALQEVVQNAGKKVYDENQDLLHGIGEAAFIGGILGGMFGGAGAVLPQGQAAADGDQVGPAGQEGATAEPGAGRPSILADPEGPGQNAANAADDKAKQAAAQAGVTPAKIEKIKTEVLTTVDLDFINAPQDPVVVESRSETLKKEQDLQVAALEQDLAGEPSSIPTYPVEELPSDTPLPYPVEEIEEITATQAMRPAQPARPPRYDVAGLVASPEIIAQPVDEASPTDGGGAEPVVEEESVTVVTTPPQDTGLSVPETEQQPQQDEEKIEGYKATVAEQESGPEAAAKAPAIPDKISDIDVEATQARPEEASEAQISAGNYKKGKINIGGLDVSIENEAGTKRRPEWPTLSANYGYIRGTEAKDGEQVDVFIKPGTDSATIEDTQVFVVDQTTANGKTFDETKTMVGYGSIDEARAGYLSNYSSGWKGLGAITATSFGDFKTWLSSGNTKNPFAGQASTVSGVGQIPTPKEVERPQTPKSKRGAQMAAEIEKANASLPKGYKVAEGREGGTRFLISTGPNGEKIQSASGLELTPRALAEAVRGIKLEASRKGKPAPTERIPSVGPAPVETIAPAQEVVTPAPAPAPKDPIRQAISDANATLPDGYKILPKNINGEKKLAVVGPNGRLIPEMYGISQTPSGIAEAKRKIEGMAAPTPTSAEPAAALIETPAEAVDMAKIVASTGPIRAYAIARGHKWPMGPNSKKYKQLKAEYTAAREKYEQEQAGEPAPAQSAPEQVAPKKPAPAIQGTDRDGDAASKLSTAEIGEQILNNRIRFGPWLAEIQRSGIGGRFQATIDGPFTAFSETPYTVNAEPFDVFARDRLAPKIKELLSKTNPTPKARAQPKKVPRGPQDTAQKPAAEPEKGAKSLRLIKMPPETVEIEETGETATIEESAQVAIERVDGKLRALYQLRDCLRS